MLRNVHLLFSFKRLAMSTLHKMFFIALLIISVAFYPVSAYRFLGIFPFNGKSHNLFFEALTKGLAREGHLVDVISHFTEPNPPKNYNVIVNLEEKVERLMDNVTYQYVMSIKDHDVQVVSLQFGNKLCDLLGLEEIETVIKTADKRPYDGVIVEAFGANCFMGFGHLFKVPVIGITSCVELPWVNDYMGNQDNVAIYPTIFTAASGRMSFWKRLQNLIVHYHAMFMFHSYSEDYQTEIMRKYLGPDLPNIREVEKSVALLLSNSHVSVNGVKPIPPSIVQLAGLHIEADAAIISPDLKKWLDESEHGVVYFSFGSFLKVQSFPAEILMSFYASFANISPTRVLMKVSKTKKLPPGLPANVLQLSWVPQIPVLGHKNTRVFINHGGLLGIIEAVYHGVPMVSSPVIREQWHNVHNMLAKNVAILLPLDKLTEDTLTNALKTILHDSSYRERAKNLSKLFRDRPMSSMQTALFWINYVIKYGPSMLKSPATELQWWQVALLDVYGFILLVMTVIILISILIAVKMYKYIPTISFRHVHSQKKKN